MNQRETENMNYFLSGKTCNSNQEMNAEVGDILYVREYPAIITFKTIYPMGGVRYSFKRIMSEKAPKEIHQKAAQQGL